MSIYKIIDSQISNDEKINIFKQKYFMYVRTEEKYSNLTLLKYFKNKSEDKYFNEMSTQCRGLIYDNELNEIRCFPPERATSYDKFFQNLEHDNIEFKNILVEDFIDGTMVNVFYDKSQKKHLISTRSRIGADCYWSSDKTFSEMFYEVATQQGLNFSSFHQDICFTFVLVHPNNRIVVKHQKADLILVSARRLYSDHYENLDLVEIQNEYKQNGIDVKIPIRYSFNTVEEMQEHLEQQDLTKQGFVLKHKNMRTKIRNSKYAHVKSMKSNTPFLINTYLELRKKRKVDQFLKHFEEYKDIFREFQEEIHSITYEIYNWYVNCHKIRQYNVKEIPYQYKPHCRNLHNMYKKSVENKNKKPIKLNDVISYVNNLPVHSLVFIRNFYLQDK